MIILTFYSDCSKLMTCIFSLYIFNFTQIISDGVFMLNILKLILFCLSIVLCFFCRFLKQTGCPDIDLISYFYLALSVTSVIFIILLSFTSKGKKYTIANILFFYTIHSFILKGFTTDSFISALLTIIFYLFTHLCYLCDIRKTVITVTKIKRYDIICHQLNYIDEQAHKNFFFSFFYKIDNNEMKLIKANSNCISFCFIKADEEPFVEILNTSRYYLNDIYDMYTRYNETNSTSYKLHISKNLLNIY